MSTLLDALLPAAKLADAMEADRAHGFVVTAPKVPRLQVFRALCGRRPSFLSQSDADAYDAGYLAHINGSGPGAMGSPHARGYFDAEARAQRSVGL